MGGDWLKNLHVSAPIPMIHGNGERLSHRVHLRGHLLRRQPTLIWRAALWGLLCGVAVYFVMSYVVLPLSAMLGRGVVFARALPEFPNGFSGRPRIWTTAHGFAIVRASSMMATRC